MAGLDENPHMEPVTCNQYDVHPERLLTSALADAHV